MSYISIFLCRIGIQSNLLCCPKCRQSGLMCFRLDPAVTLDVWRRINQLSDPPSRQLTLLWTPVNIAGFLCKTCNFTRAVFPLTDALCLQRVSGSAPDSIIRGYVVKWSQEDTKWSGWRDGGETQAEFPIGSGRCDISVLAVVHAGPNVSAHMTIPQRPDGGGGEHRPPAGWISEADVITAKLRLASLHRNPPSLEAAVRRRGCCLQLDLDQTGSCHLWLHGGVVQPRRQRSLCPAMDEGASRKQHAVSTCWYFFFLFFFLQWSSRRTVFHGFDPFMVLFSREFPGWLQTYIQHLWMHRKWTQAAGDPDWLYTRAS